MKAKGWTYKEKSEQLSKNKKKRKREREKDLAAYLNSSLSTDLE